MMTAYFVDIPTVDSDIGFMPIEKAIDWQAVEERLAVLDLGKLDTIERYRLIEYIVERDDVTRPSARATVAPKTSAGGKKGDWQTIHDELVHIGVIAKLDDFEISHLILDITVHQNRPKEG